MDNFEPSLSQVAPVREGSGQKVFYGVQHYDRIFDELLYHLVAHEKFAEKLKDHYARAAKRSFESNDG